MMFFPLQIESSSRFQLLDFRFVQNTRRQISSFRHWDSSRYGFVRNSALRTVQPIAIWRVLFLLSRAKTRKEMLMCTIHGADVSILFHAYLWRDQFWRRISSHSCTSLFFADHRETVLSQVLSFELRPPRAFRFSRQTSALHFVLGAIHLMECPDWMNEWLRYRTWGLKHLVSVLLIR